MNIDELRKRASELDTRIKAHHSLSRTAFFRSKQRYGHLLSSLLVAAGDAPIELVLPTEVDGVLRVELVSGGRLLVGSISTADRDSPQPVSVEVRTLASPTRMLIESYASVWGPDTVNPGWPGDLSYEVHWEDGFRLKIPHYLPAEEMAGSQALFERAREDI